jgi:predicted transcriptional regulator
MASANFNTQILSSNYEKQNTEYFLDDVITKGFNGPYSYSFTNEVPNGVSLNGDILTIAERLTFVLSITVNAGDKNNPISVIATTNVTIDTTKDYAKEVEILLDNPNMTQKVTDTKSNWASIIGKL